MRPEQQALRMGDSASAPFGLANTTEVSWSKTNMVSKKIGSSHETVRKNSLTN